MQRFEGARLFAVGKYYTTLITSIAWNDIPRNVVPGGDRRRGCCRLCGRRRQLGIDVCDVDFPAVSTAAPTGPLNPVIGGVGAPSAWLEPHRRYRSSACCCRGLLPRFFCRVDGHAEGFAQPGGCFSSDR